MKIRIITENKSYNRNIKAEHGFSTLVQKDGKKILFDTGASKDVFYNNWKTIYGETMDADFLIFSHPHYDHVNGCMAFLGKDSLLKLANKKLVIYYHSYMLKSIKNKDGQETGSSNELREFLLKNLNRIEKDNLVFTLVEKEPIELFKDVYISGLIELFDREQVNSDFFVDGKKYEMDTELYLAIIEDSHINILTGCSHRGINNIILDAEKKFQLPIGSVIGGFHFKGLSSIKIGNIGKFLNKHSEKLYPCHCTTLEGICLLKNINDNVILINSGDEIN